MDKMGLVALIVGLGIMYRRGLCDLGFPSGGNHRSKRADRDRCSARRSYACGIWPVDCQRLRAGIIKGKDRFRRTGPGSDPHSGFHFSHFLCLRSEGNHTGGYSHGWSGSKTGDGCKDLDPCFRNSFQVILKKNSAKYPTWEKINR